MLNGLGQCLVFEDQMPGLPSRRGLEIGLGNDRLRVRGRDELLAGAKRDGRFGLWRDLNNAKNRRWRCPLDDHMPLNQCHQHCPAEPLHVEGRADGDDRFRARSDCEWPRDIMGNIEPRTATIKLERAGTL